jgi:glycosyltransferase involved in cell wall biosynthesis
MFTRWTCGFAGLGWRVTHIAPEGPVIPEFPSGAEFIPIRMHSGYVSRIRHVGRVLAHLDRVRPDIILFPDPELFLILPRYAKRSGFRLVFDRHENFDQPGTLVRYGPLASLIARGYSRFERWITPRIDGVIVVLEDMIPSLDPRTTVQVAHNFPTRAVLQELAGEVSPETPRFTCVNLGAMHVERGLYEQLEVARAMVLDRGRRDFRFCLGGLFPPGTLERSREFVRAHRLEQHVHLVESFLPQSEVIQLYRGARIGFSPYLNNEKAKITLQNKILEFMGAGLPVLTSPSSENGRIVRESGCGALFWADETDAICDKLEEWMNSPEEARRLGEAGRQYVLHNLVWEADLERIERWFHELCRRSS